MKLKTLFFFTLLAAQNGVQAADLLETFRAAQANDPVIAGAYATMQAGEEKLAQGRSLLMPAVNLSANTTMNQLNVQYSPAVPPFLMGGDYRFNSHGYNVNMVQPLYRQQNWLAYSESELQVAAAQAQYKVAEQDLVLRTAQAYFDVLNAQDGVELAEAQKSAITEQLGQAKRNFEVGSATITDTLEAQARFDLVGAQQLAAQNNLENKRRVLQQLTNSLPGNLKRLDTAIKLEAPQPADAEKWIADAQLNSPQLAVAKANTQFAEKEVARNRGGHYPTVDLVANYGNSYASGSQFGLGDNMRNANIGVQLNVPLFQGGMINSKWREAQANYERAQQDLESAHRNATLQTSQAYLGVVSGIAQVQALQQALASGTSVLEATKTGQEVGVRTNLDVLNAQQQLYSTRRDLYQAEYNFLLSKLRLKAAAGVLDVDGLIEVNQALH